MVVFSRRVALASVALLVNHKQAAPALAFDNRLPPDEIMLKYPTPKTPGPAPRNLGIAADGTLRPCDDGKPHCFSSSRPASEDDDGDLPGGEWLIEPFRYKDRSAETAYAELREAILEYPPGQDGIDGGGWRIIKESEQAGVRYVYVQFESLRKGYIDDVEFAVRDGIVDMRSSSRLGFLDIGVNAKRLNWFAARLKQANSWETSQITPKTAPEYFQLNSRS